MSHTAFIAGDSIIRNPYQRHRSRRPSGAAAPPASAQESWGGLVATSGTVDYSTIQGAINANLKTFWVKPGSYTENLTFDENCQMVKFEGNTTITGTITVSANYVHLEFGPNCTITGAVTWSGSNGVINGKNNVNFNSSITFSSGSLNSFMSLGGLGSLIGGEMEIRDNDISISSFNSLVSTGTNAIDIAGTSKRTVACNLSVENGGSLHALAVNGSTATDSILSFIHSPDSPGSGVASFSAKTIIFGNHSLSSGSYGFQSDADDNVLVGNISKDPITGPIRLLSSSDDNIVSANRTDGSSVDLGTGNTVANNNTAAF